MECPNCKTVNPEQAKFCMNCAAAMALVCPECGTGLPSAASFCFNCAAPVVVPAASDLPDRHPVSQRLRRLIPKEYAEQLLSPRLRVTHERRMVTILFSDIQGSTRMAENLDPEEVMEVMNGAFDVLIEPIVRHEGTVARLMGDAVLAFFGAPIAHEDDAERACRAALEIVEGAKTYAEKLERERGIDGFNVRVGINTGRVVVGEVGSDLRVEYTAMGDAVNLAARMEQNAPPGGILITHDTYRHVRGVFDVRACPPLKVRGRSEPIQSYVVQRAKPQAFRKSLHGVEGVEVRMVGREAELLFLKNAFLDAIEESETRVITVVGEAGVGKSRLLNEFDAWSELHPERFWYFKGRASSDTERVPYGVWRDLFASRFEILASDSATVALAKFREGMADILEPDRADLVGQLVGFEFGKAGSEAVKKLLGSSRFGELAQAYLFKYVKGMLQGLPVLMLLEDLHWADDSSLDLLASLAEGIPQERLLIVGTARPTLFERRSHWAEGLAACSQLDLRPLSRRITRGLVNEILRKAEEVPEALVELVVEVAEGSPFYVEELIKMLVEDGVITAGPETWAVEAGRLVDIRVPPTLLGILQARLDRLPHAEKVVLQRASVIGQVFWDGAVEQLTKDLTSERKVISLLERLRKRELVYRRERSSFADDEEYTFKHGLLRDVAYGTLLKKSRRDYHGEVAKWLEVNAGERIGEYLSLIARHWELARDEGKAAHYLRRSGEELLAVSAFRDAAAAFERALVMRSPSDVAFRAPALVRLGRARSSLGQYGRAEERFDEALKLAEAGGILDVKVAALCGLGEAGWWQGSYDTAESYLEAALPLARSSGDDQGEALVLWNLGYVAWRQGRLEAAEDFLKESLNAYEDLGHRQGVADGLKALGIVSHLRGEYAEARRYEEQSLKVFEQIGNLRGVASCLIVLGENERYAGRHRRAEEYYLRSIAISEEIGFRQGVAINLANLGHVHAALGDESSSWAYFRQTLEECLALESVWGILDALVGVASLWAATGQRQEEAAELLGLALRHPAAGADTRKTARPLLVKLREAT
ncbi:MAG: adenylate/guanylate cyclase domain-containing protein, partial [Anaerolineae bacterium]